MREFIKKKNVQLKEGNPKAGRSDICSQRSKPWFGQGGGAISNSHWKLAVPSTCSSSEPSRKGPTAAYLLSLSSLPTPASSGGGWGRVIGFHPNLEVKLAPKWSSGCFCGGLLGPCWDWPGCSGPRGPHWTP